MMSNGHPADQAADTFLNKYLAEGVNIFSGSHVTYHDGYFMTSWYGEHVLIDASELDGEDILRYGLEGAISRLFVEQAPINSEEYRRFGHKTVAVDGTIKHWVSRMDRIYPAYSFKKEWTIDPAPAATEFKATWNDGLVRVESNNDRRIPHESIAYGVEFLQKILGGEFVINSDTSVAIYEHATRDVVIGHHKFIERLCEHSALDCRPWFATDLDTLLVR